MYISQPGLALEVLQLFENIDHYFRAGNYHRAIHRNYFVAHP